LQSKAELEEWYRNPDPWVYKTTPADLKRKAEIIMALHQVNQFQEYERAIDIGCGEGFVTESIPAKIIHGIEISDLAASRFSSNVIRVHEPQDKYDLVMTTGTLYQQYDHRQFKEWIESCSSKHILIAGIKDWLIHYDFGKIILEKEFSYREYTQRLVIYEIST
jgi:trans-aconitate methyltransferase